MISSKPCWEVILTDQSKPRLYVYQDTPKEVYEVLANHGVHRTSVRTVKPAPPLTAVVIADNNPSRETRK